MAGKFEIQGLDESLTFTFLVAKEKFRASLKRIDPVNDELDVTLKPYRTDVPENQKMLGKIVDTNGKPIVGAVVWITGAKQKGQEWWGRVQQVDRASITAKDGQFLLTSEIPYEQWQLTVRANRYCQAKTEHQPTGSKPYEIKLRRGVNVTGQVIDESGKPVAGHIVGLLQRNRMGLQNWIGERTIATDKGGRFTFTAVLPETEWAIYSAIEGRANVEFFQSELFDSGDNDTDQELGKFKIKGHGNLSGRLILPPGESLPEELRITVSRKYAWNPQTADVKADGSFSFPNLPLGEPLIIRVSAAGLQLDLDRQTLQSGEEHELGVFLDKDSLDVKIPMMKAQTAPNDGV